jgi:hypothetical protein
MNRKPDQERHEKSGKNAAVHHPKTEAPMTVEIIDRKPTAIVGFSIPDLQSDLSIALTAVIIGIVALLLFLLRALFAWR